ncbi:unnamed protein product [Mytilus coruscus]|uniref:CCHC-type domain-containing protein n=1 Tax=Mytilus coruscus TaxID=42192 RepID=A0A6J8D5R4_MYTCO|nr:unnamed protein product [Mytilus coruscus]
MLNKCIYDMISVNFPELKNHSNSTTTNEKSCEKNELSQAKSIIFITSNTCTNTENKNIHEYNSGISTENNSNMKNKEDIKELHSDTGTVSQPLQNVNELLQARENITQDENSVKSLLHQLLDKTGSLFELVKSIDEQRIEDKQDFQNKINLVNDRITAFSKQMCTNDKHQAEHLREIENSVKLVKIEQDKIFSQDHNKIQRLSDRVKDIPSRRIDASKIGKDVDIRTNRGATVPILTEKIRKFNIHHCSSIILVVGGNDASSRIQPEAFRENYEFMIKTVKSINPSIDIAVSEICPRRNVNTDVYNTILHRISTELNFKIIKQTDAFVSRGGDLVSTYYHRDGKHLTNQGTIQLLRNINRVVNIFIRTNSSQSNNENNEQRGKRQSIVNTFNGICFNCGFYGHHYKDCHTF